MPRFHRRASVPCAQRAHRSERFVRVEPLETRTLFSGVTSLSVLIGGGAARSVQYVDVNGTRASVAVLNAGHGTLDFTGSNLTETPGGGGVVVSGGDVTLASVTLTNTTLSSILKVNARGSEPITIGSIDADGAMNSIIAPGAMLTGNLTTAAWIHRLTLYGAQDGLITIGPSHINGGLVVSLGAATDESLTSDVRIDSLSAAEWVNALTTSQTITTPQLMKLKVKGNFAPNLAVAGVNGARFAMQSVAVGAITGGTWTVGGRLQTFRTGSISGGWSAGVNGVMDAFSVTHDAAMSLTALSISTMTIGGTLSNSTVDLNLPLAPRGNNLNALNVRGGIISSTLSSVGGIGSIAAAQMRDSSIEAGLAPLPAGQALPQVTTDFANVAEIKSVTIRRSGAGSFVGSDIAAYQLGVVNLGSVVMTNGGTTFGVGAHSIKSVTLVDHATGKTAQESNPPSAAVFSDVLVAKGITPGDFTVNVV